MKGEDFELLHRDIKLVRIATQKHEIADDRRLKAPIAMVRNPPRNDDSDNYTYDNEDQQRAHIMPRGISERGSPMWLVLDVASMAEYWVERRSLSERFLSFAAHAEGRS